MCLFVLCVLCFTVLVNAFAICVGELNVFFLKLLCFCWLICVWSSKEYVCDPSVWLGGPSIYQICVFV